MIDEKDPMATASDLLGDRPPVPLDEPLPLFAFSWRNPAQSEPTTAVTREPADLALYTCRAIERLRLGTSYLDVAEHIAGRLDFLARRTPAVPELYIDSTGVGLPVVDILRRRLVGIPHRLVPITITTGDGYHAAVMADGTSKTARDAPRSSRGLRVGKGFLVSRLQALIQCERFRLPDLDEATLLQQQLRDFHVKTRVQTVSYGAVAGEHDDLVIAAALSVLDRPRQDSSHGMLCLHG